MKISIKFIIGVLLICFIFISCKTEHSVIGKYSKVFRSPKYMPSSYNLHLNVDSTFFYTYYAWEYTQVKSFGMWNVNPNNKNLILKSYISDLNSIPIKVDESRNNVEKNTIIIFDKPMYESEFVPKNPKPDWYDSTKGSIYWNIILNENIRYPVKSNNKLDSIVIPHEIIVNNFYLQGYANFEGVMSTPLRDTVTTQIYYVKGVNNNIYSVTFPFPKLKFGDVFYYKPINDTLKMKGKSLIWGKEKVKLKKVEEQSIK